MPNYAESTAKNSGLIKGKIEVFGMLMVILKVTPAPWFGKSKQIMPKKKFFPFFQIHLGGQKHSWAYVSLSFTLYIPHALSTVF